MNPRIQILAIIGSILVMLIVAELIRRRKLREEYALFWFGASAIRSPMRYSNIGSASPARATPRTFCKACSYFATRQNT